MVVAVYDIQAEAEAERLRDDTQEDVEAEARVSDLLDATARSCGGSLVESLLDHYTRRNPRHWVTQHAMWRPEQWATSWLPC